MKLVLQLKANWEHESEGKRELGRSDKKNQNPSPTIYLLVLTVSYSLLKNNDSRGKETKYYCGNIKKPRDLTHLVSVEDDSSGCE